MKIHDIWYLPLVWLVLHAAQPVTGHKTHSFCTSKSRHCLRENLNVDSNSNEVPLRNEIFMARQLQIAKLNLHLRGGEDYSDDDRPTAVPSATSSLFSAVDANVSSMLHSHDTDWSKLDKDRVFEGLKNLYLKRVKPLEDASWYSHFSTGSTMVASDFDAKPIVLLLGQYSVGKTSFIRALLGKDFPGMRIGPEPTTDRFVAVWLLIPPPSMPFPSTLLSSTVLLHRAARRPSPRPLGAV